jgi:hypothetical protein
LFFGDQAIVNVLKDSNKPQQNVLKPDAPFLLSTEGRLDEIERETNPKKIVDVRLDSGTLLLFPYGSENGQ